MSDLGTCGHLYPHRVGDAHRPPAVGLSQRAQSPSEQRGGTWMDPAPLATLLVVHSHLSALP